MSDSDRPRSPFAGIADFSARPVRVLSDDEIERMLADHRLYLETEWSQGHRANFASADLSQRDFSGCNLRGIKMDRAVIKGANFIETRLHSANLVGAILHGARFDRADLTGARLSGANLVSANLENACLAKADMEFALLGKALLRGACLCEADLADRVVWGSRYPYHDTTSAWDALARLREANVPEPLIVRMMSGNAVRQFAVAPLRKPTA